MVETTPELVSWLGKFFQMFSALFMVLLSSKKLARKVKNRHFLWIAKASCGELRTQIFIGRDITYIARPLAENWITETRERSKMLCGLINKISD